MKDPFVDNRMLTYNALGFSSALRLLDFVVTSFK